MKIRTLILSATLLLTIAGSWWLTSTIHINKYSAGTPNSSPDSYGFNIILASTNSKGKLISYFTTPRMIQYAKQNVTEIMQPRIVLYGATPKHIRANYAKNYGNQSIILQGNVIISQGKPNQSTIIKTSSLTFYPKQNVAKTKFPVTISQPTSFTKAVGLITNLNTGELQLLSKVQTTYHPHKIKTSASAQG